MSTDERTSMDRAEIQRLASRLTVLHAKNQHLTETLTAVESSAAWAIARRITNLRRLLSPQGSRRQRGLQLIVRGLRLWRREGLFALARRLRHKVLSRFGSVSPFKYEDETMEIVEPRSIASAAASSTFKIAFLGLGAACEAQSMRYRARNVLEALDLVGVTGMFATIEEMPARLPEIIAHDLIVLVRVPLNFVTRMTIDAARKLGRPIIYDIDDYLFDPWVMPYIEAFRNFPHSEALRILGAYGECLQECDYFTGSTAYLAERATAFGKPSFVIHNGINAKQLQLSQCAMERETIQSRDGHIRLGYFSGTRTHQADFRVIYPALMECLSKRRDARLTIVGELDLGEFPGLTPKAEQIETLPIRTWTELPATMASIDINLIPLELTPFNEGKSNLKYFEAAMLKVPSIASPTRIHRDSIVHGQNGLLANNGQEWSNGLNKLVADAEMRKRMGQNAYEHVLRNYTPIAIAAEAFDVYRQIVQIHRVKCAA